MVKLLDSAVANARHENESVDIDTLFVKTLTVDKGMTLKRMRPFKQGRAGRLHHIMSTVTSRARHQVRQGAESREDRRSR